MAKNYQIEKEIRGNKYIAQYAGISVAIKAVDACYIDGSSNISIEKMAKYLFEHVIVEPKNLSIDDFDSIEELNEVVAFARGVMQGDFRDKTVESKTEKKG